MLDGMDRVPVGEHKCENKPESKMRKGASIKERLPMEVAISFFASSEPHPFREFSNKFKKPGRKGGRRCCW